jgi:hypothetical protein
MKAYKVEILIIDFDGLGENGIKIELENANFANDCIHPNVKNIKSVDIGEWTDSHPLNITTTANDEYKRLFNI